MRMGSAPVPSRVANPVWQLTPIWHPSPNFGLRRDGLTPRFVVLHYTAMESCQKARDWLCNPEAEVSAHYLIDRDGTVIQMVAEGMRAWHAGAGGWQGCEDVNSASIGIELANTGAEPFPELQMAALEKLLAGLLPAHNIPPEGVIAHSDLAPGRKIDPGAWFDWKRLALQGVAAWPDLDPDKGLYADAWVSEDEIDQLLRAVGYTPEEAIQKRLDAFRLHFLPRSEGPANGADRLMLLQLLNDYPALNQIDPAAPSA